mgnify:CR=1 FL=1
MTKLERLVLSGMFALNTALPSISHSFTDDEKLRARQEYAERNNQPSREENEANRIAEENRVRRERESDEQLKKDLKEHVRQEHIRKSHPKYYGGVSSSDGIKKDRRSDLQKVKDGIKKEGNAYCEVSSLALGLYVKSKNIKTKNKVSTEEYKSLAVITCNECFKWREDNYEYFQLSTGDNLELLKKLDELNIGNWETYAMLARHTDNSQTQRYVYIAFNKNKNKAKKYLLKTMDRREIEKYNVNKL